MANYSAVPVLSLLLVLACCPAGRGQLPATYPFAEEFTLTSFEEGPFYFSPASASPRGMGIFEAAAQVLPAHPLTLIADNPARLSDALNGRGYLYLRAGTLPEQRTDISPFSTYPCASCLSYATYTVDRTVTEPAVSFAALYRPERENRLTLGVLWHIYRIRQEYYGALLPPEGFSSPLFSGDQTGEQHRSSKLAQNGHFPVLFASWTFSGGVSAGLRMGYAWYRGDGLARGTGNEEDGAGTARSSIHETAVREQRYTHVDLSAGIDLPLNNRLRSGFAFGYLSGTAEQTEFFLRDYSRSAPESLFTGEYYVDNREQAGNAVWERKGYTLYGSADLFFEPDERHFWRLFYRGRYHSQTPESGYAGSGLNSFSEVYQTNRGEEFRMDSYHESSLSRTGSGDLGSRHHTLGVRLRFRPSAGTVLTAGIRAAVQRRNAFSAEDVERVQRSQVQSVRTDGGRPENTETESPHAARQFLQMDRDDLAFYGPVVFSWQITRPVAVEAAVMPVWLHRERTTAFESVPDPQVRPDEEPYETGFESDHSSFRIHPYAAVEISPLERVIFRLSGMPDYRELAVMSYSSKTEAWRFDASMEITW